MSGVALQITVILPRTLVNKARRRGSGLLYAPALLARLVNFTRSRKSSHPARSKETCSRTHNLLQEGSPTGRTRRGLPH